MLHPFLDDAQRLMKERIAYFYQKRCKKTKSLFALLNTSSHASEPLLYGLTVNFGFLSACASFNDISDNERG